MSARKAASGDGPYPLPEGWRWVNLGNIISPAKSARAGEESFPILSMTMHGGLVDQGDKFKKKIASNDLSSYKVVLRGQLVVGFPIDEGVLDFQSLYESAIVSPAYQVWDLASEDLVDRNYLSIYLHSPDALSYYRSKLQSTTARRRSLKREDFLDFQVPVPSLSEQRRIAEILNKGKFVRAEEGRCLQRLSELVGAEFDRRFGNLQNGTVRLGDIVLGIDSGKSPKCESFPADSGNWGVLKLSAVTGGAYRPSENKAIFDENSIDQKIEVNVGDVLMTRKNTPELVGEVCYVSETPERMLIPDLVFRVRLDDEKISGKVFQVLMMRPVVREKVRALAGGSAKSMSNISKARLRGLDVVVPSLAEQLEFESFLDQLEGVKRRVLAAGSKAQELFSSLQFRAFRGEL